MSYSQLAQDLTVINFFKKFNGYFIEIGAIDGIELSNTYLLEKEFGWSGICVEPIPEVYEKLVVNRPNSKCYSSALFSTSGKDVTFDVAAWSLISGVSQYISPLWKNQVNNGKTQITVKTATLLEILDKAKAPNFIEYLSLDTEGTELEILKSVPEVPTAKN
jgi:FkbM family methyltransferase